METAYISPLSLAVTTSDILGQPAKGLVGTPISIEQNAHHKSVGSSYFSDIYATYSASTKPLSVAAFSSSVPFELEEDSNPLQVIPFNASFQETQQVISPIPEVGIDRLSVQRAEISTSQLTTNTETKHHQIDEGRTSISQDGLRSKPAMESAENKPALKFYEQSFIESQPLTDQKQMTKPVGDSLLVPKPSVLPELVSSVAIAASGKAIDNPLLSREALIPVIRDFYKQYTGQNFADTDSPVPTLEIKKAVIKEQHLFQPLLTERAEVTHSQPSALAAATLATELSQANADQQRQSVGVKRLDAGASTASHEPSGKMMMTNPVPKLGQRILQMVSRGESSIEIRLDPPELGKLTLSLAMDKETLNLQIITPNSAVRDLLMTHDDRLRQALAEQGMSLGSLAVNVQTEPDRENLDERPLDNAALAMGFIADEREVDQSFIPAALLFQVQGGRLLDQFI